MSDWLPLVCVAVLLPLSALLADRVAAGRAPDRGTYWARVTWLALLPIGLGLALSWGLKALDAELWHRGLHLMPDLAMPDSSPAYWLALALPGLVWLLMLGAALFTGLDEPRTGRWLAGAVGLRSSRRWLLLFPVLSLLLLAALATQRLLDARPRGYPAGVWTLLLIAATTLAGVALSRGRPRPGQSAQASGASAATVEAWPEALRAAGVAVDTLAFYPAAGESTDAQGQPVADDCNRPDLAVRRLPARLWDALTSMPGGETGNRLVAAPEHSGQVECLALLAERQLAHANTLLLVIVPDDIDGLKRALLRWLPDAASAEPLHKGLRADSPALVWIADAKGLSDLWIPLLQEKPDLLNRIGAVVWWDLHRYSGVLAANFWAISHRFQRLLAAADRVDLRHLTFVRGAPTADTQFQAFINLCLPSEFQASPAEEAEIDAAFAGAAEMHLLGLDAAGQTGAVQSALAAIRQLDPALAAAKASVAAGWPTCLRPPAHLSAQELAQFGRLPQGGAVLDELLHPDPAEAGAYVLEIDAAEVLALLDIVAQTGRIPATLPLRHIGIVPAFGNPYVAWLLGRLRAEPDLLRRLSRRLVAAKPQSGVITRHLLLALNELPATLRGLNRTFRFEAADITRTLHRLAEQNRVAGRDVRFLSGGADDPRLRVELEYRSTLSRDPAPPLSAIGTRLVDVFDPARGSLLQLDPERLTIDAYPLRVFLHQGRRYRIADWSSVEAIAGDGGSLRVECQAEGRVTKTWRVFAPRLSDTQVIPERRDIQIAGRNLTLVRVATSYEERISGRLEFAQDGATGRWTSGAHLRFPAMLTSRRLRTSGLFVRWPEQAVKGLPLGLHSLAQALRHVFPVHVGVDEDAVAILALHDKRIDERPLWGIMIVDLYPGSIGLIQSMEEDPNLVVQLLQLTRDWLAACTCDEDWGCEACLKSPLARAAIADNITMRLSRREALALLAQVLGA